MTNTDAYEISSRGKESRRGKPKHAARLDADRTTIWFKDDSDKSKFGQVFEAVRLARTMVDKSVSKLENEKDESLTQQVLNYHFGGKNEQAKKVEEFELAAIIKRFKKIQRGLNAEVIVCVSKNLGRDRGLTTKENKTICINLPAMEGDLSQSIAATIIHEASHKYFGAPGGPDDVYAFNDRYTKQGTGETVDRADSYAYAALSFHEARLITYRNWHNGAGFTSED